MRRYSSRRITEGSFIDCRAECSAVEENSSGCGDALENQDQRPPRRADVDRLVARVQNQHRLLQSVHRSPS